MAEPKTQRTDDDVAAFLAGVADDRRRADTAAAVEIFREATGEAPAMWGTAIIGFGTYTLTYANGRTNPWPAVGLSPRKQALTLYVSGFEGYDELLSRLGTHSTGKSCLYVKRLADVDRAVLHDLVKASYARWNGRTVTSGDG
jgi:hypothetical protein